MRDRPGLIGRLWYDAAYWTMWTIFTLGFSYRGTGRWNVPKRGPALILSNHQSMFDPMLVGLSLPRYPAFLALSTESGSRSTTRSPSDTMPPGCPPSTTGTRRMAWVRMNCTPSSTLSLGGTVTEA